MANSVYSQVESVVSEYVGKDKAELALSRQLERLETTADKLVASQLAQMLNFLMGSVMLYLPDKTKQAELKSRIQAIS